MANKHYAYINNNMLKWARSKTIFSSVEDVEHHSNGKIKAQDLNKWEIGEDLPSINKAKILANLYRVPLACFYLSECPKKEPKRYVDRRTSLKSIYMDMSYELWSELRRIESNRENIITLIDEKVYDWSLIEYDKNLPQLCENIRKCLNIKLPFKNKSSAKIAFKYYRNILENNGIMVAQLSHVALDEMKGISIFYSKVPIIGINNKDYDRSKVFTMFHELAHLIRRSSSMCLIDFNEKNDEEENLCDKIAAEILMPKKIFEYEANMLWKDFASLDRDFLEELGNRFGVSIFSVLRRLKDLGLIKLNVFLELYSAYNEEFLLHKSEIDARRDDISVPIKFYIKYLNKEGYLFARTVILGHNTGLINYGEMCRILNVKSSHISKIEQAVLF